MNHNQLKIVFVLSMVVFAVIAKVDRDDLRKTAIQDTISDTSLVAAAKPIVSNSKKFPQASDLLDSVKTSPSMLPFYQRNWDIPEPQLQVKAALVSDISEEGDILFRWQSNNYWPLASLTKLMAAVIAIEEVGFDKIVTISETAVSAEGIAGNFSPEEQYSVSDLVRAMMMVSSNDAASAIAEFYGANAFVDRMQIKAAALGMGQTTFADPTGLSFLNQGTAEDLEKLVGYIYNKHPVIFKMTAEKTAIISEKISRISRQLVNINPFSATKPDFRGGKTGFTDQAGSNLISLFDQDGHTILVIVLGTQDRFGQTELLYNWFKKAYIFN